MSEPNQETLTALMEQHLKDSLRTWSRRPVAELVNEFVNVRGDLSQPASQEQLTKLIDLKVADAERAAVVKALRKAELYFDLKDAQTQGMTMTDAMLWCNVQADAVENGADL